MRQRLTLVSFCVAFCAGMACSLIVDTRGRCETDGDCLSTQ